MTTEEIKKIIDDERAEQLTILICRHWDVATQRLDTLAQEVTDGIDTCTEAEIYAALMRMQKTVMALMELNKIPTALLFSEYLERINKTVSNNNIRQSVMTLVQRLLGETSDNKQAAPFFDLVIQTMAQHVALPTEQQEAIQQIASPAQYIFSVCAQHLKPEDLMMVAQVIQNINTEDDAKDQEEIISPNSGHASGYGNARQSDERESADDAGSSADISAITCSDGQADAATPNQ